MDQGEPGKDLPILEQTQEPSWDRELQEDGGNHRADPRYAHSHYWDGQCPVWGYSPVALQEQFSPFEDVSPPAEPPKVIFFFANLDCGFSSKYVVMNNEKMY